MKGKLDKEKVEAENKGKGSKKTVDSKSKPSLAFSEDIVREVNTDFEERAEKRRQLEIQWQLNSNFVAGNQYCYINSLFEIEDSDRDYFWQEREVFNHIAPIYETRLAKLARVRPRMTVRPASGDEDDIKTSKAAAKILNSACNRIDFNKLVSNATMWSELCGSAFYKIVWDNNSGNIVGDADGEKIFEGDVKIEVCSPFEIYPSTLLGQDINEITSIIHAKALPICEIERIWGQKVQPSKVNVLALNNFSSVGGLGVSSQASGFKAAKKDDYCIVIERYTMPSQEKPEGEFAIVAGDKLLYYGELPFINGDNFTRELPFVKQDALVRPGSFFGSGMIERAIPIQRAYNAVKNRKHEFMNRIAMGVLAVEDGSVDVDNLAEEGLSPGKILVYRQGSSPPRLMDPGRVPSDFAQEEDRLLSEFIAVSGVSEIMRSSSLPTNLTSGVALQLLIEQDDTRLTVTAENIRSAVKKTAQHILRLYKQFAKETRLCRAVGNEGEIELLCWNSSDIGCDDVVFETENELSSTPAAKQSVMIDLLKMGLLHDEKGKLSDSVRYKILSVFGYGGWEVTKDLESLNYNTADKENKYALKSDLEVLEIDNHQIHINEHSRFVLSTDFTKLCKKHTNLKNKMLSHIKEHKTFAVLEKEAEKGEPENAVE